MASEDPKQALTTQDLEALYAIGHGYLSNGKYKQAAELFALLVHHAPANARYWCALGACAHSVGQVEAAVVAYQVARQLDPKDALVAANLAEIRVLQRNLPEAVSILQSVVNEAGDGQARVWAMLRSLNR